MSCPQSPRDGEELPVRANTPTADQVRVLPKSPCGPGAATRGTERDEAVAAAQGQPRSVGGLRGAANGPERPGRDRIAAGHWNGSERLED